jgi:hypothetical protein
VTLAEGFDAAGCDSEVVNMKDLSWQVDMTFGAALEQLQARLFAEFWSLPEDVHRELLDELARWVDRQPAGRATVQTLTPHLSVGVFRKRGG